MKRHLLFSMICILLFAVFVNTGFADYIGPNPDLRTYTEYTIKQISIPGLYVQCVDDTASPARTLGQYCDISHTPAPIEMTPPAVTSCDSFAGATRSVIIHSEKQRDGVTLDLLWREYVEECHRNGELPYQSTQFNKLYNDFLRKKNATMHLDHKPGEIMQVDWAGDTTQIIDTDTGESIKVYIFVATLPYSGYSYVEGFFSMDQECWISAHVNALKFLGVSPKSFSVTT